MPVNKKRLVKSDWSYKKKEKVNSVLNRKERVIVLKTLKVLNGRVFYIDIRSKPSMCDLFNVVELKLRLICLLPIVQFCMRIK